MGHEFVGIVDRIGSQVTGFHPGDKVVSTFTIQCGKCWYCERGFTSKCPDSVPFGTPQLEGAQAEFVRVPFADATLSLKPVDCVVDDATLLLMSDIFPTGYYGIHSVIQHLCTVQKLQEIVVLQLGCGPVGLCALVAARECGLKHVIAVDSVPDRLKWAEDLGATALNLNEPDLIKSTLEKATNGRGADAVLEVVGSSEALRMGFDYVRRNGFLCSLGYQHSAIPFSGLECYLKNLTIQFGRCPARAVFEPALEIFKTVAHELDFFVDHKVPLNQKNVKEAYNLFDQHKVRKVCFAFPDSRDDVSGK